MGWEDKPIIPIPENYYVYVHYLGDKPVYVGKGSNDRVLSWRDRNYDFDGYKIAVEGLSEEAALLAEKILIEEIGYENLANADPKEVSKEERQRRSERAKSYRHTEERKKKISEANKRRNQKEEIDPIYYIRKHLNHEKEEVQNT